MHNADANSGKTKTHSSLLLYNKTSCFKYIKFIFEDTKVKHINITTKLKWKVYTKVIIRPSKEA